MAAAVAITSASAPITSSPGQSSSGRGRRESRLQEPLHHPHRDRRRSLRPHRAAGIRRGLSLQNAGSGSISAPRKARGRGIGVSVERRLVEAAAAGPEAGADHLVAVSLARHRVRQVGNAARMRRRRSAGEPRDRKIEAAPEQLDRRALAAVERAKDGEIALGLEKCAMQAARRIAIPFARAIVLSERHRVGNFVRRSRQAAPAAPAGPAARSSLGERRRWALPQREGASRSAVIALDPKRRRQRKSSSTVNCRSSPGSKRVIAPRGVRRNAACQP